MKSMLQSNLAGNLLRLITALFCAMLVTACGGGGGSPGNTTNSALFTTAPSDLLISPAETKIYSISGGVTPYRVSSSAGSVVAVVEGTQLRITGGGGGSSTLVVSDNIGATVSIKVTIGAGFDLFTTAGTSVTVAVGATSIEYSISGGSQNYAVSSSNTAIATVGISGNRFVINGVSGGKAIVTVRDSTGKAVAIDVIVGSANALYTTAGGDISVAVGATQTFLIGGGSTPYTVSSTNPGVATATVSGTTLSIKGNVSGSAIVVVSDGTGTTSKINVTVGATQALFSTAPNSVTLGLNEAATYTVGGGIQPYTVSSSNTSSVKATISGSALTLAATATVGTAQIIITDAAGKVLAIAATVSSGPAVPLFTSAPPAITVQPGASPTYSVGGGTAPYTATSSNVSVATTSVTGTTLTVNGVAAGTANIVIRDAVGGTVTLSVTTASVAGAALGVFPSTAAGRVGDTLNFTITGGTAPYKVTSNNPAISTIGGSPVATSGGSFTAALINAGTTTFSIIDAGGQTQAVTVTIAQTSPLLRLSPSAITIDEKSNVSIPLNVFGGTAPYVAYTSDSRLAPVSVSGAVLTIAPSATNRCVLADTTVTITVVDTTGASATSNLLVKDNGVCP